jgi:hypothetical protein
MTGRSYAQTFPRWSVGTKNEIRSESVPDDPKNLEDFVNSMEAIVSTELAEWREGFFTGDLAEKKVDASKYK